MQLSTQVRAMENHSESPFAIFSILHFFESVFVDEPDVGPEISCSSEEGSLVRVTFVPETVERAILEIKASKSGGPDGVHGEVLRKCAKQLAVPLSMLFQ